MRGLGIDVDLAPVLDVEHAPGSFLGPNGRVEMTVRELLPMAFEL